MVEKLKSTRGQEVTQQDAVKGHRSNGWRGALQLPAGGKGMQKGKKHIVLTSLAQGKSWLDFNLC